MDWAERYADDNTPWDMGRAHPELARRLADHRLAASASASARRVLVPGCGRGHDALALARAGFAVTAVDIVAQLESSVGSALAAHGGRFVVSDALSLSEPHELLFEHTFFCALPPTLRPRYGEMAARCVAPGGTLHAVVFPLDKTPRDQGPPFQMTTGDLSSALGDAFELQEDAAIEPISDRPWGARWVCFQRR
jgi:SAM-dependent methyltransferase